MVVLILSGVTSMLLLVPPFASSSYCDHLRVQYVLYCDQVVLDISSNPLRSQTRTIMRRGQSEPPGRGPRTKVVVTRLQHNEPPPSNLHQCNPPLLIEALPAVGDACTADRFRPFLIPSPSSPLPVHRMIGTTVDLGAVLSTAQLFAADNVLALYLRSPYCLLGCWLLQLCFVLSGFPYISHSTPRTVPCLMTSSIICLLRPTKAYSSFNKSSAVVTGPW